MFKNNEKGMKMECRAIGIASSKYKGYTASVEGIVEMYGPGERPLPVLDMEKPAYDLTAELRRIAQNSAHIDVIGAGEAGLECFLSLIERHPDLNELHERGKLNFVFSTDKYHDINLFGIQRITIMAPKQALDKFAKNNRNMKINALQVDLIACGSKEAMHAAAAEFMAANIYPSEQISRFEYSIAYFLGGRVQDETGNWKENTPAIFRKEAEKLLKTARGGNIMVCTHGLRSFTNADGSSQFGPADAFVNTLRNGIVSGQAVKIAGRMYDGSAERSPALITLRRSGYGGAGARHRPRPAATPFRSMAFMNMAEIAAGGSIYHFIQTDAIAKGALLIPTAEQMTFPSEIRELGGDMRKIRPSYWDLSVPSNVALYRNVQFKAALGMKLLDARGSYAAAKVRRPSAISRISGSAAEEMATAGR